MILLIILALILLAVLLIVSVFNKFARNRNAVQDAWSNIDAALKRRHDLLPALVNTVKGYAAHERHTLEGVTEARQAAMLVPAGDINGRIAAEDRLQGALRGMFALSEQYPDLKASASFLELQQQLGEIETNLERSRRYYNATVRDNNTYGESFPGVLLAGLLRYRPFSFFEAEDTERSPVPVDFSSPPPGSTPHP